MAVRSKKEFADCLRNESERAGFTDATSLAEHIGLNPSTVRTWLRGETEPRFLQLAALAEVVNVSLDKLAYTDASGVKGAAGDDLWDQFSEPQQAALVRCMRLLAKLSKRLAPQYDPVSMFAATIQSTSEMCDTFIGKLPSGTVVASDHTVVGRTIRTYDPPAGGTSRTNRVGEAAPVYGKKNRSRRKK